MIFNKLYKSEDHYIIVYNSNNILKVYYRHNNVYVKNIDHINKNILDEMSEAFNMYQFPFAFIRKNNSCVEMSFLGLLHSRITFYVEDGALYCKIVHDGNLWKKYRAKNFETDIYRLYLGGVEDIDPLTYIDDIKVFNHIDKGYPYVYLIIPKYKYREILDLCDEHGWKIIIRK